MNKNLIQELQNAISMLKKDISKKRKKLEELTSQYQKFGGSEINDDNNKDDLTE